MWWALAAGISIAVYCGAAFGTLVPLSDSDHVEYLFVWPGGAAVVAIVIVALAAAVLAYALVCLGARRWAPASLTEARTGRWLAPISLMGVLTFGILPAVPGVGDRGAPLAYWLYDLRWWWIAIIAGWTLVRADRLLGSPVARHLSAVNTWSSVTRVLLGDAVVFAALVVWAIATTPLIRFSGRIVGDEPKYLRNCEVLYQGRGLDVSNKTLLVDEPLDAPPAVLRNVRLLASTIGEEARALAIDLRAFASSPASFRWNRVGGHDGFVTGKRGGVYQLYQPGLSAVLFPGYFLDRYLFGIDAGYQNEFPAELVMTNTMMLLVYGLCGVALFRLLRHALSSDRLSALWAAIGMATMPVTAFAFQFYPELPAALLVIVVSTYLLFHAPKSSAVAACAAGAAAASLVWLHPRFLLVASVFFATGLARTRSTARVAYLSGFVPVLMSVMLFDYHVTGSWLPTALWDAQRSGEVTVNTGLLMNLIGYGFDRTWGLFPHSPLLLAVVPGLVVLFRQSPGQGAFLATVGLALAIPAAGHTLSAAGTTPDRLVAAVVPTFILPVAVFLRRFWSSSSVRVSALLLVVLSLDAALAYNLGNGKRFGSLHDASVTGWKPNLAFPIIRGTVWDESTANFVLFVAIAAILAGVAIGAWVRAGQLKSGQSVSSRVRPAATIGVLLVAGVWSFGGAWLNRDWTSGDYLIDRDPATRMAAAALVQLRHCRVCFTSQHRQVDWTWLEPNPARDPAIDVGIDGHDVRVRADFGSKGNVEGFGRMAITFGDGSAPILTGVVGSREVVHHYRQPGHFEIGITLYLRDDVRVERRTIEIAPHD
jgi:hypothetical protein